MSGNTQTLEYTGIADEGAAGLEKQIMLHEELGWKSIELRTIDGVNVCSLDEHAFERAAGLIDEHAFSVAGFGSAIANWSRAITGDFSLDQDELQRAVPRMRRVNSQYIRIMSYTQGAADPDFWAVEAIRRLQELTSIAEGEGITLLLENCDGWAAMSPENFERLLSIIPSPALQVVFDMGNPRAHHHEKEAVFDFLAVCAPRVAHLHIKDCYLDPSGEVVHCFPGEGECYVLETAKKLIETHNYRGRISIEPHMVFQFHKGVDYAEAADKKKAENYLAYGRKTMELLAPLMENVR